jgi:hypothetical protein
MMHPTDQRLEAFCDGTLPKGERAGIESHLTGCSTCRGEVNEWRSLFIALAGLPHLTPAPGFALRVMAHVQIPRPWHVRASALVAKALPHTTPGWAFAVLLLAIPALAAGSLAFWLLSKSYLTAAGLWAFATDRFAMGANRLVSGAFSAAIETDVMAWLVQSTGTFLDAAGLRGLGAVAVAGAGLTLLSIWVLYRNLSRTTPSRGTSHVTFSF